MLNDTKIRQAKPRERDYKLADYDGLYLLVRPTEAKLWRLAYRFGGKQKSLALGAYPMVTLAEARAGRDVARKLIANGTDPSLKRRLEKIAKAAGGNSFREVSEEFLEKRGRENLAQITLKKNRWLLVPAFETFGDRPVGEVTAPDAADQMDVDPRTETEAKRAVRLSRSQAPLKILDPLQGASRRSHEYRSIPLPASTDPAWHPLRCRRQYGCVPANHLPRDPQSQARAANCRLIC